MEYPGSRFTRPFRRLVLAIFVLAFFIISPLVIITTAGYRISWSPRTITLHGSGSISVDIIPTSARASLNGTPLSGGMPYRINSLIPDRTYTLSLSAPGYYDWQKDITVSSGETYYLKDIGMLKRSDPSLLISGTVPYASLSPKNHTLAYTLLTPKNLELHLYSSPSASSTLLASFPKDSTVDISWLPGSDWGLLTVKNKTTNFILFNTFKQTVTNLATLFPGPITHAVWDRGQERLYLSVKNILYSYSPTNETLTAIGKLPSSVWSADGNIVWALVPATSTDEWVIEKDYFGFGVPYAREQVDTAGALADWSIALAENNTLLLENKTARLFALYADGKKFSIPALNFLESPFGSWLLMWSPTELWTYAPHEEPKLLNRSGEWLGAVAPLDQYNTLALAYRAHTVALYPYYQISHELLPGALAIVAEPSTRVLYLSGTFNGKTGLWQLTY